MKLEKCIKESFTVIGKEGSTNDDVEAPIGWTKWIIPACEYLYVENNGNDTFLSVIKYFQENSIPLVGAAHDFNCPETGKGYIFFPIQRL